MQRETVTYSTELFSTVKNLFNFQKIIILLTPLI